VTPNWHRRWHRFEEQSRSLKLAVDLEHGVDGADGVEQLDVTEVGSRRQAHPPPSWARQAQCTLRCEAFGFGLTSAG
jgi:hypothetical protein